MAAVPLPRGPALVPVTANPSTVLGICSGAVWAEGSSWGSCWALQEGEGGFMFPARMFTWLRVGQGLRQHQPCCATPGRAAPEELIRACGTLVIGVTCQELLGLQKWLGWCSEDSSMPCAFAWREPWLLRQSAPAVRGRGCAPTGFEININPGSFLEKSCAQRYKWLLRRRKDFSDFPDYQGLDEKKSSLIVLRANQQIFLGKIQSALGQGQV